MAAIKKRKTFKIIPQIRNSFDKLFYFLCNHMFFVYIFVVLVKAFFYLLQHFIKKSIRKVTSAIIRKTRTIEINFDTNLFRSRVPELAPSSIDFT